MRSFAYWDPELIKTSKLLNPESGEYQNVEIQPLESRTFVINNRTHVANGYRLVTKDINIDVWYTQEQHWIALESETPVGKLRYLPQQAESNS